MSKRFDRICPGRSTTTTESIANGKTIKIYLYRFLRPTLTDLNYKLPKKEIAAVKQVMWNKVDIWLISEKNRLAISE